METNNLQQLLEELRASLSDEREDNTEAGGVINDMMALRALQHAMGDLLDNAVNDTARFRGWLIPWIIHQWSKEGMEEDPEAFVLALCAGLKSLEEMEEELGNEFFDTFITTCEGIKRHAMLHKEHREDGECNHDLTDNISPN